MKKILRFSLLALLMTVFNGAWAESTTFTFANGSIPSAGGDFTLNEVTWNASITWKTSGQSYMGWNNDKGIQIGSAKKPATSVVLKTSGISGNITDVIVNASVASGGETTLDVTVGGVTFGEQRDLHTDPSTFIMSGEVATAGEIVISFNQPETSSAIYVKYITVVTEDEGNPICITLNQKLNSLTLGKVYNLSDMIEVELDPEADPDKVVHVESDYDDSFEPTETGGYKAVKEGVAQMKVIYSYNPGEGVENPYRPVEKTFWFYIVDESIEPELSFEPVSMTVLQGAEYTKPTLNCTPEIRGLLSITTSNHDVAFWDDETGLIIGNVLGTATITATYNGSYLDGKYKSATATLVVNVVDELPTEATATFDATEDKASTGSTAGAWNITKDGLTISCTNGVGGNGSEYRIYKNQTFTVSSTVGKITKIDFTTESDYGVTGFGTVEGLEGNTWTGNADEVEFTASEKQVRIKTVTITYEPNGVNPVADITTELTQLEVGSPIRWDDFVITYADGIENPESEVSVDYDCDGFQMDLEQGLVPEEEGTATITFHFVYEGEETTYSDVDKTFTFNVVDNRPDPEFAFTPAKMTIVLGEEFEQPVFTSADNDYFLDGGQALVTSTNENVAYWTPEEGLVVVGLGTTDIKVTFISQFFDEWKSCEAVLSVNVVDELPTEVTATFDATKDIASTGTSQTEWSITKDGLTISCTNGVGGNGSEYRIYKNQIFTVSSTVGKITKIEFTATRDNPVSGFGEVEGLNGDTWTGSADEVAFTASGAQVRLTLVNVTYEPIGVEEPITVTISESTYATFYYESKAFEIPEGITASAVVRDGSSLSEIPVENVIPAGCPVLLHGAAGEYEFVETTEEGVMPTANSLIGSEEGGTYNEAGYKYYVLSWRNKNKNPEEVGFYYLSGSKGAYAKVKAHQAYMRVTSTQANEAGYVIGETTGITSIAADGTDSTAPMYNLAGQRVNDSFRGVVIQNGKKTIKK